MQLRCCYLSFAFSIAARNIAASRTCQGRGRLDAVQPVAGKRRGRYFGVMDREGVLDVVRKVYKETNAEIIFVDGYPEMSGTPWLDGGETFGAK